MDNLYWSWVPGIPKKMKWPVKIVEWGGKNEDPLIFSRSDDAYFRVSVNQLVAFPGQLEKFKTIGNASLRKKPCTLLAFTGDIEWALRETDDQLSGQSRIEKANCATDTVNSNPDVKEMNSNTTDGDKSDNCVSADEMNSNTIDGDKSDNCVSADEMNSNTTDGDKSDNCVSADEMNSNTTDGDKSDNCVSADEMNSNTTDGDKSDNCVSADEMNSNTTDGDESDNCVSADEMNSNTTDGDKSDNCVSADEMNSNTTDGDKSDNCVSADEMNSNTTDGDESDNCVSADEMNSNTTDGDKSDNCVSADEMNSNTTDGDKSGNCVNVKEMNSNATDGDKSDKCVNVKEMNSNTTDGDESDNCVNVKEMNSNTTDGDESDNCVSTDEMNSNTTYGDESDNCVSTDEMNLGANDTSKMENTEVDGNNNCDTRIHGSDIDSNCCELKNDTDIGRDDEESEDILSDDSVENPQYKPSVSDLEDLNDDVDDDVMSTSNASETSAVFNHFPAIVCADQNGHEFDNGPHVEIQDDPPVEITGGKSQPEETSFGTGSANSERHEHPSPTEECISRDKKYPHIYIRNGNSEYGNQERKKDKKRVYDNYHCCLFCKKLKSNIRKHLLTHKDNPTVKKIFKLKIENEKKNRKEIERLLAILRNAGDNGHNMSVCQGKKGELIVSRRVFPFDHSDFGPCTDCLEWIKMGVSATKHLNNCPAANVYKQKLTKGQMVVRSNVVKGLIAPEASDSLIANVYPIMTRDEITRIVQGDSLIVALGNFIYRQNVNNKSKRKYTTSSRMRGAARLLKYLKEKHGNSMGMCDFLNVDFFEDIVEAALKCASPNSDDIEDLKHPSTAVKAGHDILQMADIQMGFAVKGRNQLGKEEVEGFMFLMRKQWQNRVGRLAKKLLRERRMLKDVKLPNPKDLQSLAEYLKEKLDKENFDNYRSTAQLSLCRLLLYNKRRSGELENTLKVNYVARSLHMDESDEGVIGDLTDLEKKLLGSQEIMKIEGKGEQVVPVIIPTDTTRALQYIMNVNIRKSARVKEDNPFLFATTGEGPIRAYEALKQVCQDVGVAAPDTITSVNVRKYFATMTQVIGLRDHELGWLCKHLGHTVNVHKLHYRAASGYIERIKIGKLMLMQDFNVASRFRGKDLEDIHVEDILRDAEKKETVLDDIESAMECEPAIGSTSTSPTSLLLSSQTGGKKHTKITRQKWTLDEEKELKELFKDNLKNYTCPSKQQISWAMGQSRKLNGNIHLRTLENIKKKVWNMYQSNKRSGH